MFEVSSVAEKRGTKGATVEIEVPMLRKCVGRYLKPDPCNGRFPGILGRP